VNIEQLLELPYHIEIVRSVSEEDGDAGWVAKVREWPGCFTQGRTPADLMANIRDAMLTWAAAEIEDGRGIPPPTEDGEYSGQFRVRLPRGLHAAVAAAAEREGVSLNSYVSAALAGATGWAGGRSGEVSRTRAAGGRLSA
jgi:predicted RNase H-like HicB family nuclease